MENGDHHSQITHRYLTYLPQDNNGLSDAQSEQVLQAINDDLGSLLSASVDDFWQIMGSNASLLSCLDSYLRFARRPFDEPQGFPSDTQLQISRRVFATFSRLVSTTGTSPGSQHAQMLYDKWVLDVPKLLDLAAIYGPDNASLLQQLLKQTFRIQPQYTRDLWDTGPALSINLHDVQQTCKQASDGLKRDSKDARLLNGLADGLQYLRDTCLTLSFFLEAYPSGSQLLQQGQAGLITQLTSLHDDLVPQINKAATSASHHQKAEAAQVLHNLRHLSPALQKLSSLLISEACLQDTPAPQLSQPPWGGAQAFSPHARGELLMGAVMTMAQPSQHTPKSAALLNALITSYALAKESQAAITKGIVQLDLDQQDYLGVLLGDPSSFGSQAGNKFLAAGNISSGQKSQQALASYISQIKDIMPHFGDGFLASALQHFSYNSEQVIHCLLEGNLPIELKGLDPQMPLQPPSQNLAKGKGLAQPDGDVPEARWSDLAVAAAASDKPSSGSANPTLTAQQAAKRSAHKATSKMLDTRTNAEKAAQLQFADAAQWEYEDEYDDSFDDLAPFGNDGVADAEGDDEVSTAHPGALTQPGNERPPGFSGPSRGQGGQQHAQRGGKPTKQWVKDGKIYNYKKEGATEVSGKAGVAQQAVQAAADAIHGLGAGGNVPLAPPQAPPSSQDGGNEDQPGSSQDRWAGSNRGRGGRHVGTQRGSSSNLQRDHRHKDVHKAAVANHHRKDRALRKQGGPAA